MSLEEGLPGTVDTKNSGGLMHRYFRHLFTAGVAGIALTLMVPLAAQAPAGASPVPTKQNPIRFTAFNVATNVGAAGVTEITIERWSTPAERKALLELVQTAKFGQKGQEPLLEALQKIEPPVGRLATTRSLGWDLRYAYEFKLTDGSRQIVIATDKPVSFAGAHYNGTNMDYPFTLIELRMKADGTGEGRMLSAASILVKNGRLELENYGQQPVLLTSVKEERLGKKK